MKIMFLQELTGGLLNGLLNGRLKGLFTRMPVLAVLLLTAVVAACGSDSNSSTPAAAPSNQPPVSNKAPVFSAGNSPGVQFTPVNGTIPASYSFADIPHNLPAGDLVGNVSAMDPDGDAISYNISDDAGVDALFKINATTGEINLIARANNIGDSPDVYKFNATASDGKGGSTIATISVEVLPNQAPMFVAVSGSGQFTPAAGATPANYIFADLHIASPVGSSVGNVSATDVNRDVITYSISAKSIRTGDNAVDNELFKINSTTGEITLLGVVGFAGEYHVNATATDDQGESTEATIFVNIYDITPPAFTRTPYNFDLSLSMAIDGAVVGNVSAMDAEETAFGYSLEGGGDLFEFADADNPDRTRNIILGRPATLSDFAAPSITFRVMATHTIGEISSEPAAINVNLNNDLQFGDDSDTDGVIDPYDASPHDDTTSVTGNGEPDAPYIISNIYQLQAIAGVDHEGTALGSSSFTNNSFLYGADAAEQLTKHYILANDIDASNTTDATVWTKSEVEETTGPVAESSEVDGSSDAVGSIDMDDSSEGHGWTPIAGSDGQSFSGSFSGEGYAINSLTSMLRQGAASKNFGLFGINNGNITAVGLQDASMIIKALDDTYTKSTTINNITLGSHFGGLVGLNQEDGIISYSYTTGNVSASMDAIGGLVGLNQGEISYSYSTVTIEGEGDTGGLVGANVGGAILSSYATGSVTGGVGIIDRDGTAGGLAGSISGVGAIISTSYATGSVTDGTTPSGSLGGVVAERNQTTGNGVIIESSYWDNVRTGVSSGVGKNRDDISVAGDETGTFSFTTAQLQGCELDGMPSSEPTCTGLFPSSHWDTNTQDGVIRDWIFRSRNYPSLSAFRTSGTTNKQLLPTLLEQECHHNGMPLGC